MEREDGATLHDGIVVLIETIKALIRGFYSFITKVVF